MHLIDKIADILHCTYISDIGDGRMDMTSIAFAVKKIGEGVHSLDEWNETVTYVTGEKVNYTSEDEARRRLSENPDDSDKE